MLVIAAPAAASAVDSERVVFEVFVAALVFTLASAAVYLGNDLADVDVDRAHPTKRHRPIAAGTLSVATASRMGVALVVAAIVIAALLRPEFAVVIAVYLLINVGYSAGLKHQPYLELGIVAAGFVLRAVGGGVATDIALSRWFILVVCSGSLFIVVGKRSAELRRTADLATRARARRVLAAYTPSRLHLLRAVCGGVAVLAYALWTVRTNEVVGWLALSSLFLFTAALARYSAAIDAGRGEDPEDIVLGDRVFQLIGLGWLLVYGGAVYG